MPRRLSVVLSAFAALLLSAAPVVADEQGKAERVRVQLLGFNDFHGQLGVGKRVGERPAGSAPVLAAYLRHETARFPGETLIVHAGDIVGASPPSSALLQDEPTIAFLNLLANGHCRYESRFDPRCNLVGTFGNHEFDEGARELLRLVHGGKAPSGPYLERPYRGARFPYVSANVVRAASGQPIAPRYVIKRLGGVRVGVIGAVLAETPSLVVADGVRSLRFLDESSAINRAARELRARAVETIVVTIHQGVAQPPYEGPTREAGALPSSEIVQIVSELDPAVDVVISGHAHAFTNALVRTASGHPVLVTQALSAGTAYAAIELELDRRSGDVVHKTARVEVTYADAGPGLTPAADVAALVARAEAKVAPLVERVLGRAPLTVLQAQNSAGESPLGSLIADAQRSASGAQIAFMNQGGIRCDLDAGEVTWGDLFQLHPFGNRLVSMELTGAELLAILEQQWQSSPPRMLQVSGLSYVWDAQRPVGSRVVSASLAGQPLDPAMPYRVVVNDFLAGGSGGFAQFTEGRKRSTGESDLDALGRFITARGGLVEPPREGRIVKRE